jgi:outer membrane protein assembly factor BamB
MFVVAVLLGHRYTRAPVSKWVLVPLGAATYLLAIRALLKVSAGGRKLTLLVLPACALTGVYYAPTLAAWVNDPRAALEGALGRGNASVDGSYEERLRRERLIAVLFNVSSAEEQARLATGSYVASTDSLRPWMPESRSSYGLRIDEVGALGWSAHVSDSGTSCEIWARDPRLRTTDSMPEGQPVCEHSSLPHVVPTSQRRTVSRTEPARPFGRSDIVGVWTQHRADPKRSGIVSDSAQGASWTTQVEGELRAPVAIAGNQVFVGAHGNGEFEALSLRDGRVGFRVRAPNWIHHEPVVTPSLVIVGFGNNERSVINPEGLGTEPSGVVAYDRQTGREVWRFTTDGAVMTSPILYDSLLVGVSGGGTAFALNASNGRRVWIAHLPSFSAMGNPLLVDSTLAIGVELTTICTLRVTTGRLLYCRSLSKLGWGAGHTSIAAAGSEYVAVYDGKGHLTFHEWLNAVLAIVQPSRRRRTPLVTGELVAVGLDRATGETRWATPLGVGTVDVQGHIAGTPTIVGGVAYIPSSVSGRVVAIDVSSGRTLWSTATKTARGSLLVMDQRVVGATHDSALVVLDAKTGAVVCRQRLPGAADRAGPTVSGNTGILTLLNGLVLARPVSSWLSCKV